MQIFRRADKNDDGKLSLEEFQSYFNDGVLTDEQMQELYRSIDRQNFQLKKFCFYFSPHVGEYINVLSALEKLNVAILKAMDKTKEEYQGSSVLGQFVTRFLLRETSTQLQSLQSSLDCAMEALRPPCVKFSCSPHACVAFLRVLWFFLPHSKNMHDRLIEHSKLSIGVGVSADGCSSQCAL
uniref:EF-hand domain-containing protein n=1 Tax=Hippocampus comes TaxID=109280 RepID=A0A3Q3EBE6_HIPCM